MRLQPILSEPAPGPVLELTPARASDLGGGFAVRRALPTRGRRAIGAWCFLDHFGPIRMRGDRMDVAPHPHTGLSTVTWLLSGEVVHKDGLGTTQRIRPGQLNWMTAGRGIVHSEEGDPAWEGEMHGVQLWVALPDAHRHVEPAFAHHPELPGLDVGDGHVTVLVGACDGVLSPARTYSPLVGLDVVLPAGGRARVPVDPAHEHGLVVVSGEVTVDRVPVEPGWLAYLGRGRAELTLATGPGARLVVVGGEPLGEPLLIGWNFVERDHDELVAVREAWERGDARFAPVSHYTRGPRLAAPPLG